MRVVMLDIDGVLNSSAYLLRPDVLDELEAGAIDPILVARLNRLVAATGAVVVVSSSWRYGRTVDRLREILESRGFIGVVHDKIPDFSKRTESGNLYASPERGDEIRGWLDEHPEVTAFVVLDYDSDMAAVRDRHIKTSSHGGGLLDEHVDRAIAMLLAKVDEEAKEKA